MIPTTCAYDMDDYIENWGICGRLSAEAAGSSANKPQQSRNNRKTFAQFRLAELYGDLSTVRVTRVCRVVDNFVDFVIIGDII